MEDWIHLAMGPLFRVALAVFVLGLGYQFAVALAYVVTAWHRAGDRDVAWRVAAQATLSWVFPRRLLKARPVYSAASFLFHVGIILIPLTYAGHVVLMGTWVPSFWPRLGLLGADILTGVTLAGLAVILVGRIATHSSRALSRLGDYLILVLLLLTVALGYLAAHPGLIPLGARGMLLAHVLLADALLIISPVSKIAHCVLFPLTQVVFQLGWHFPAASGRQVGLALGKEGEPV